MGVLMKTKIVPALLFAFTLGFICLGSTITARASSEWTLEIDGALSNPTVLTLSEIIAQPKTTVYGEIYCYGVFATGGNWTGVSLSFLLDIVEPDYSATSLGFHAEDGYAREIPIAEATGEDVILAYELNGQPLIETLRLVLPGANGDLWVSMVSQIIVSANPAGTIYTAPWTGFNLPALQPSPVSQQLPTPQPTPIPQPSPTPPPEQTQPPSQGPSSPTPPITNSISEPDSIVWIAGATSAVIIVTSLAISFKKRLWTREENALR